MICFGKTNIYSCDNKNANILEETDTFGIKCAILS